MLVCLKHQGLVYLCINGKGILHVPVALEHTSRETQSFATLEFFAALSELLAKVEVSSLSQFHQH